MIVSIKNDLALAAAIALGLVATSALAAPKVFSLDQCADQYVLALSPRADIVGLSKRATKSDSYLAARARGLPMRRATAEEVLAARPDVVVRWWGGDESMPSSKIFTRSIAMRRSRDSSQASSARLLGRIPGGKVSPRRL